MLSGDWPLTLDTGQPQTLPDTRPGRENLHGSRAILSRSGDLAILLALPFHALLGFGFALCARDRIRVDGPFAAPAFSLVLLFAAIVVAPVGLYLYLAHPDWAWMYLLDPGNVPVLAVIPLLAVQGAALLVAWYLGARIVQKNRQPWLLYAMGGTGSVLLVGMAAAWNRVLSYGTYQEFRRGIALDLMEVKLGYVLLAVVLAVLAAAGFVALELHRDSRRARAR